MTKKDDDFLTPSTKKIRFRGDLNSYYFDSTHIEDIFDDADRRKTKLASDQNTDDGQKKGKNPIEFSTFRNVFTKLKLLILFMLCKLYV